MKVSIIIPCYNQSHFLHDAIESAINQTYKNIEIIVVNDGSHDSTSEVAKRYEGVKLIEKENGHLSSARNAGIKVATGKYILPLDADDKIDPEFITKTIDYLEYYDIVSTWLQTFGNESKQWGSKNLEPVYQNFRHNNQINCCSLFKKSVWQELNGYDENMKQGFEDWDLWRRASRQGYKIRIVPEYLFFYRKHGRSMFAEAQEKRAFLIDFMNKKESSTGKLIDIVYPLGKGSINGNNELKFSLRSVEKHLTGYRNIFVIGEFPRWGNQNIKYIKCGETLQKSLNILEKIKIACLDERITDDFLFMNDDHIFLENCDAVTYPYYYSDYDKKKILQDRLPIDYYVKMINDTEKLLPGFKYYDIHKPIVINKSKFLDVYNKVLFHSYEHGLLIKSVYCNMSGIKGIAKKDCILRTKEDGNGISKVTNGHELFSFHDDAVCPVFIDFLDKNYPIKSIYEA
jgi:glycosyltransferase involved in cell wall biosynthesis